MKSELIMKNSNTKKKRIIKKTQKTTKNKIDYFVGKFDGSYFKFIAQRNIPLLK